MFDLAVVKFTSNTTRTGHVILAVGDENHASKTYEYRIPEHLKGQVVAGQLGIVTMKQDELKFNTGIVEIVGVRNVLDGEYNGVDYAWLVGVVDTTRHMAVVEKSKRRRKLHQLIEAEKQRVTSGLNLDALASLSPDLSALVDELRNLDGAKVAAPVDVKTYPDGNGGHVGLVHPGEQVFREEVDANDLPPFAAVDQGNIDPSSPFYAGRLVGGDRGRDDRDNIDRVQRDF